jgi:hypothetical protein
MSREIYHDKDGDWEGVPDWISFSVLIFLLLLLVGLVYGCHEMCVHHCWQLIDGV